jgi:hypothetical protein
MFRKKFIFFKQWEHTKNSDVPPNPCPKQPRSPLLMTVILVKFKKNIKVLVVKVLKKRWNRFLISCFVIIRIVYLILI